MEHSGAERAAGGLCSGAGLREWWSWERWARAGSPLVAESLPGPLRTGRTDESAEQQQCLRPSHLRSACPSARRRMPILFRAPWVREGRPWAGTNSAFFRCRGISREFWNFLQAGTFWNFPPSGPLRFAGYQVPGTELNPRQLLYSSWVTGDDGADGEKVAVCSAWPGHLCGGSSWTGTAHRDRGSPADCHPRSFLHSCVLPAVLLGTLVFSSRLVATVPACQVTGSAQG